jgi:uncharacterized protein YpmB
MIPVILVLFIVINSSMGFIVMKHNHNVNQTMTQADIDQIRAEQAAEEAERAEIAASVRHAQMHAAEAA